MTTSHTTQTPAHPVLEWTLELSIAGAPVEGRGEPISVLDPATEEELAQVPQADAEQIEHAIASARRAFDEGPWREMSGIDRSILMTRFAEGLEDRLEQLAEAIIYEVVS
jgi:aldehyde dehydrogenase (NAD+)